jgi:hypothetical protein
VAGDQTADAAAILDLERRRTEATNAGDGDALGDILAPEYRHVTGYGRFMDRDSYLEWVTAARRIHRRGPLSVAQFGDFALINGDLINEFPLEDGRRVVEAAVLQTALRRDGRWRMLSFQISVRSDTHPPRAGGG